LLSAGHIYSTPIAPSSEFNYINAPDEAAHIGYVKAIAIGHTLPVQGDRKFPTYEWHQPPLYYVIAAPFYNLGPTAVRWLTSMIGLVSLFFMFRVCRALFPGDAFIPILTVGFAAFLPMRQAVFSSVGNDSLTELMFVAEFLIVIRAMKGGLTYKRSAIIGIILGAALLTKASALLLIPFICVAYSLMLRNGERVTTILRSALLSLGIAAGLSGFWFARNVKLYGEFTPARAFLREFEGTKKASDFIRGDATRLDYIQEAADWTARSFFAAHTKHPAAARNGEVKDVRAKKKLENDARKGVPSFWPTGLYMPYWFYVLLGVAGLVRLYPRRDAELTSLQIQAIQMALLMTILVVASFAAFVWTFFQTQGRYLYPALLPISLSVGIGVRQIVPVRYLTATSLIIIALFLILSVAFLFTAIIPGYS
jgi:hypothetical protein